MIGIYKIISPTDKIYIGQSTNIEKRLDNYRRLECKDQPIIYNSIKKYGWNYHQNEVIEECLVEQLDERELYWKQYYINLLDWKQMLFCHLIDGKGGYKSEETKRKMSESIRKVPGRSLNMSLSKKGKPSMKKGKKYGKYKKETKRRVYEGKGLVSKNIMDNTTTSYIYK